MIVDFSMYILSTFFNLLLLFYFSGIKLTIKKFLSSYILYTSIMLFGGILHALVPHILHYTFFNFIAFLVISYLFNKQSPLHLIVLYALFPLVFIDVLRKFLLFATVFLLNSTINQIEHFQNLSSLLTVISPLLVYLFYRVMHYQIKDIGQIVLHKKGKIYIIGMNIMMGLYYAISSISFSVTALYNINTISVRYGLAILYIIIFLASINLMDRYIQRQIQDELDFHKHVQLKNMAEYSHHIEELYKEVRSFRHDYANILSTLHSGIEQGNLKLIEDTYHRVLEQTGKQFQNQKYDIGRLINIQDDAVKSMISAKFLEAQSKGIAISLEVPETIYPKYIDLFDFLTILSVLLDNAIEAAIECTHPSISMTYFENNHEQKLIVQNTIPKERVDTSMLYKTATSTKGDDRGLGLRKIANIKRRYLNMSLRTESKDYKFTQIVTIRRV